MATQSKTPRIERGIVKLFVPHNTGEIAFAQPSIGPDNYQKVGEEILRREQLVPTGDYTASLVHSAYCSPEVQDEPEFNDVQDKMGRSWLWVFNRNLWTDKGVYVVKDLKAVGKSEPLDINDLEKQLEGGRELSFGGIRFSEDRSVRFAPKRSYRLGGHIPESFAKDAFLIASCGEEGAEKLGQVCDTLKNKKAYLHGVDVVDGQDPEQRVSTLDEGSNGVLRFNGDSFGDYGNCRAFGVVK